MQDASDILRIMCTATSTSLSALRYGSRLKSCAHARQVAGWLIRNITGASYLDVGLMMGGKHHTTIMSNCQRVDHDIRTAGPRLEVLLRFIDTATKEK